MFFVVVLLFVCLCDFLFCYYYVVCLVCFLLSSLVCVLCVEWLCCCFVFVHVHMFDSLLTVVFAMVLRVIVLCVRSCSFLLFACIV